MSPVTHGLPLLKAEGRDLALPLRLMSSGSPHSLQPLRPLAGPQGPCPPHTMYFLDSQLASSPPHSCSDCLLLNKASMGHSLSIMTHLPSFLISFLCNSFSFYTTQNPYFCSLPALLTVTAVSGTEPLTSGGCWCRLLPESPTVPYGIRKKSALQKAGCCSDLELLN